MTSCFKRFILFFFLPAFTFLLLVSYEKRASTTCEVVSKQSRTLTCLKSFTYAKPHVETARGLGSSGDGEGLGPSTESLVTSFLQSLLCTNLGWTYVKETYSSHHCTAHRVVVAKKRDTILVWVLLQESTESKINSNVSERFTVSITLITKLKFDFILFQRDTYKISISVVSPPSSHWTLVKVPALLAVGRGWGLGRNTLPPVSSLVPFAAFLRDFKQCSQCSVVFDHKQHIFLVLKFLSCRAEWLPSIMQCTKCPSPPH